MSTVLNLSDELTVLSLIHLLFSLYSFLAMPFALKSTLLDTNIAVSTLIYLVFSVFITLSISLKSI